jgi:bifunctional ADP-heptose synthase (sugar kinase/adenylyltransferase)
MQTERKRRRLKEPIRPIVDENARARDLALAAVDAVVVFGDAMPLRVIGAPRPDAIFRGGTIGLIPWWEEEKFSDGADR